MIRKILLLIVGDLFLVLLAVYAASLLRYGVPLSPGDLSASEAGRLLLFVATLLFMSFLSELYNVGKHMTKKETLVRVGIVVLSSLVTLSALYYLTPSVMFGRGVFLLSLCLFGLGQYLWHMTCDSLSMLEGFAQRVLILGTGPLAEQIGSLVTIKNHSHVLKGYVACTTEQVCVPAGAIVGNGGGLVDTVKKARAQKVVVSLSERRGHFPLQDLLNCKFSGVEVVDAPSFYEELTGKLLVENVTPSWFIFSNGFRMKPLQRRFKRLFDIFFSSLGLLVAWPLIALIGLIIRLDSAGPAFFRQVRLGEKEKPFVLYKFRTMRVNSESTTGAIWAQQDDPRCTRVGKFLRKARLDELPQLYNVLKGDMSLIGPRPERPEFVEKLNEIIPYYSERHFVKPGITGWAQVWYSYGASVEDAIEKLRYDLYYIKNVSLFLDLVILLETIKVVLFGRGSR